MSKRLENFVDDHRSDFDEELPGLHNWAQIEKKFSAPASSDRKQWFRWAVAATILMLLSASVYWALERNARQNQLTVEPAAPTRINSDFGEWPADYASVARNFSDIIQQRQNTLQRLSKTEPELVRQFQQDLSTLDSSYQVLQRQAKQSPASDVILRAMIQNLQLQAELLNKQLMIIENYSNQPNNSHEKNSTRSL